jgi:hypothetical protein
VEDLQRQLESATKEQEALIDIFSEERNRRDQEEESLRKKLKVSEQTDWWKVAAQHEPFVSCTSEHFLATYSLFGRTHLPPYRICWSNWMLPGKAAKFEEIN